MASQTRFRKIQVTPLALVTVANAKPLQLDKTSSPGILMAWLRIKEGVMDDNKPANNQAHAEFLP